MRNLCGNGWAGTGPQKGQEKALCVTARTSKMDLAFIVFFPEYGHRKGYFEKAGAVVLGAVFPLAVHMSVHPISSSPDLCWVGREAVKAKGCEHRAVPVPRPELIPASLAGGLH